MEQKHVSFIRAAQDINLNDIPSRDGNGNFQFTRGQIASLIEPQFNKLAEIAIDLLFCRNEHKKLISEIEVYQATADEFDTEYMPAIKVLETKIEEEKSVLNVRKLDRDDFEDKLRLRSIFPESNELPDKLELKKKKEENNWKSIFNFLITWLIGDMFMTYVIWNDLREDKGIEDLIVRSLSFGVVLFLVHLVTHYNKKDRKPIYYCFLAFSMLTLLIMLFAPLILNKVYPSKAATSTIAKQWSIKDGSSTNQDLKEDSVSIPVWVDLYRGYEMMPAVLCFLFFIAMRSFTTRNEAQTKTEGQANGLQLESNPIKQQINNHVEKVKRSEELLGKLTIERNETLGAYKDALSFINDEQQKAENKFVEYQKKISFLEASCEELLNKLESELNAYRIDYLDLLRDDEIKKAIIKPQWPGRNDIFNFYKLTAI